MGPRWAAQFPTARHPALFGVMCRIRLPRSQSVLHVHSDDTALGQGVQQDPSFESSWLDVVSVAGNAETKKHPKLLQRVKCSGEQRLCEAAYPVLTSREVETLLHCI